MSKKGPYVDKELQKFADQQEREKHWTEKAPTTLSNAYKACEKAAKTISNNESKRRLQKIETKSKQAADKLTHNDIQKLFAIFRSVWDEKIVDAVLLKGALDQANFTQETAWKVLEKMSVWGPSVAQRGQNPEE